MLNVAVPFYTNDLFYDKSAVPIFEAEFAKYVGTKYAVAVNSCTSALACSLEYLMHTGQLTSKSIIAIPNMTYVSVAHEITRRCKLYLDDTWHAGHMYRLQGTPIWDSAHEVRRLTKKEIGTKQLFCYSFYPTKLVPSYDGGMICTNDAKAVKFLRLYRQMGRTGYGANYNVKYLGLKCNMTPIQAQQGLESLKRLDAVKIRMREICMVYAAYGVYPHKYSDHLFIVVLKKPIAKKVSKILAAEGIETSLHFQPLTKKDVYRKEPVESNTAYLQDRILSLPYYPTMPGEYARKVAYAVKEYL